MFYFYIWSSNLSIAKKKCFCHDLHGVRNITAYSKNNAEGTFCYVVFQQRTAPLPCPFLTPLGGCHTVQSVWRCCCFPSERDFPRWQPKQPPSYSLEIELDQVWSPLHETPCTSKSVPVLTQYGQNGDFPTSNPEPLAPLHTHARSQTALFPRT